MRVEDISPRTWLLAAPAVWAVLFWVLALAGLGAHVAPLKDDPSLRQPLPVPKPSPVARLGPLAQYGETIARPLFSEDRRPKPFSLSPAGDDEQPGFDFVLTGVLLTPTAKIALLQPAGEGGKSVRVHLGDVAEGAESWRLMTLEPRRAVFIGPEGERSLELRAYEGKDGATGTPPSGQVAGALTRPPPASRPMPAQTGAPQRQPALQQPATTTATPAQPAADTTTDDQLESIRRRIQQRRQRQSQETLQLPPPTDTR